MIDKLDLKILGPDLPHDPLNPSEMLLHHLFITKTIDLKLKPQRFKWVSKQGRRGSDLPFVRASVSKT